MNIKEQRAIAGIFEQNIDQFIDLQTIDEMNYVRVVEGTMEGYFVTKVRNLDVGQIADVDLIIQPF